MKNIWSGLVIPLIIVFLMLSSCSGIQHAPVPTSTPTVTPISTSAPIVQANYEILSPEDMRSDLNELFRQLEEIHPNPYTTRSKEDVNRDRQILYEQLDEPMSIVEYYRKIAPLIASLGDDHTRVLLSQAVFQEIDRFERVFPLEIEFEDNQAFIVANYTDNPAIPLGARLLEINGEPVSDIQHQLMPDHVWSFVWKFWILNGSNPEYQVALLPAGETIPLNVTVPGITYVEMEQRIVEDEPWEVVTYRTRPEEKIGILTVNGFTSVQKPLKKAFRQIQEDGVQHLIIDVRANRGGYYESLEILLNYITDQPYQKSYKSAFIRPLNVLDRYDGKLYLLIGPDTMSAAVTLATVLQDHGLATLVGEETIEPASYCANVTIGGEPLPKTKLKFMVSHTCYIRPSGVVDNRGVIPDVVVITTIENQLAGEDPVLEHTLEMIRNSDPAP